MIIVAVPALRINTWIFKGDWMWHLRRDGKVIRWNRSSDPQLEGLDFSYMPVGDHA